MWKNYIDKYDINEYGELKNSLTGRVLVKKINHRGYIYYGISIKGKYKDVIAHRAVAELFVERIENKNQVNHIDGNKQNNYYKNLEWVDSFENMKHAFEYKLLKITKRAVSKYSKDGIFIEKYESVVLAAKDVDGKDSLIHRCCTGERKTHRNFIWKYDEKHTRHTN